MMAVTRRGFVATVLGAITAGLSRPWWERTETVPINLDEQYSGAPADAQQSGVMA